MPEDIEGISYVKWYDDITLKMEDQLRSRAASVVRDVTETVATPFASTQNLNAMQLTSAGFHHNYHKRLTPSRLVGELKSIAISTDSLVSPLCNFLLRQTKRGRSWRELGEMFQRISSVDAQLLEKLTATAWLKLPVTEGNDECIWYFLKCCLAPDAASVPDPAVDDMELQWDHAQWRPCAGDPTTDSTALPAAIDAIDADVEMIERDVHAEESKEADGDLSLAERVRRRREREEVKASGTSASSDMDISDAETAADTGASMRLMSMSIETGVSGAHFDGGLVPSSAAQLTALSNVERDAKEASVTGASGSPAALGPGAAALKKKDKADAAEKKQDDASASGGKKFNLGGIKPTTPSKASSTSNPRKSSSSSKPKKSSGGGGSSSGSASKPKKSSGGGGSGSGSASKSKKSSGDSGSGGASSSSSSSKPRKSSGGSSGGSGGSISRSRRARGGSSSSSSSASKNAASK